ncbi:dihydroorotate dehydrogenase [Gracilinema caldarium]|uniref:Dihydroorotate dehydrogenase n=1 Tax=Gracilinema caldarium (strain ATCC 51460 / DSM 7334 / H1) TaxID=744872 RepID=F8EXZ5_GRAC1|nr:dihydroorotate dehydrogenase [Gracilinema caldarium]AEJ20656.1 dihydroorotate dehydrogenase family protein [Gracilinema caldarium DSM 7334]
MHNNNIQPDLSVQIAGITFKNPVIAASGTFGYGQEYAGLIDVSRLGGICTKGLTLHPREGNRGRRLHETASGLMNSIGLENPGIPAFIEQELPAMLELGPRVIANLSGSTVEEYQEGARLLSATGIDMIELNISCPNVKAGGMAFGLCPADAATVVQAVRRVCDKPLMVKLSPNAPDLVGVALACINAGADALSLVNTFKALAFDIRRRTPIFDHVTAGLSGPAIKPLALRMVWDVCAAVQVPVVGMGGIASTEDALEFFMAGATAIQIGTATFSRPSTMIDIIEGLEQYMETERISHLSELSLQDRE